MSTPPNPCSSDLTLSESDFILSDGTTLSESDEVIIRDFIQTVKPYTDSELKFLFKFMYCLIHKFEQSIHLSVPLHRNGRLQKDKIDFVRNYNIDLSKKFDRIFTICRQIDPNFNIEQETELFSILDKFDLQQKI